MLPWLAYLTCAIVWGSTYFGIALGIESFTPFGLVATRYLTAGGAALLLSRLRGEPLPVGRDLLHLSIQGVLLLGISNALITWAERTVPSGLTAVLCSTAPFAYALLDREAIRPRTWVGLFLGLAGVGLLTWRPGAGLGAHPAGLLAIPVAVVLWAYGTLHGRRHVKGRGLLGHTGVQMLAGGCFGFLLAPVTGGFLHAPLTLRSGLAAAYLALFGSLLAYSAFIYLAKVWPATRMSTYSYLNPVVAVLLGSLVLGESFDLRAGLGMGVILLGVAVVQMPAGRLFRWRTCGGEA